MMLVQKRGLSLLWGHVSTCHNHRDCSLALIFSRKLRQIHRLPSLSSVVSAKYPLIKKKTYNFNRSLFIDRESSVISNSSGFSSLNSTSTSPWQMTHHRKFSSSRSCSGPESASVSSTLFFPEFPTIKAAESAIQFIHGLTGLPWWSTIIATAFIMRMILPLPLTAYSLHNAIRLKRLEPEIKDIALELRGEVTRAVRQFGWDQSKAKGEYIKNMKRHVRDLYIRDNCHPMKDTATFWIHIPLWLSMSYGLRNMASRAIDPHIDNHADCVSMTTEGMAWFMDLAQIDSTWILPIMLGTVTLFNFELHRSRMPSVPVTTYQKTLTFALRSIALIFIPISAAMPSGLVLYWVSSGIFASIQSLFIVRSKWFSRLIQLPDLANQGTLNGKNKV